MPSDPIPFEERIRLVELVDRVRDEFSIVLIDQRHDVLELPAQRPVARHAQHGR